MHVLNGALKMYINLPMLEEFYKYSKAVYKQTLWICLWNFRISALWIDI